MISITTLFQVPPSKGSLPATSHSKHTHIHTHTHTQTFCCVYLTGPCSERLADVVCDFFYLQFCFQYTWNFEVLTAAMLQKCVLRC